MKAMRTFIAVTLLLLSVATVAYAGSESAAPVTEKHIPFKSPEEGGAGALALRVTLGLVAVLLLGVCVLLILRKYAPFLGSRHQPATRTIELVEVRRLTPKLTLLLVEADGARYLLAQTGDRVIQLTPIPPKAPKV